jgi:SpoIIAA-like
MVVSRRFEPPDLVVAILQGVVTARDQADLVESVRASIRRAGAARLLILLDDTFGGWNLGESFDSAASWLKDDEGVSKIAIVGRREWKLSVMMLITQPLRSLPIKYFETEAAARRWLGIDAPTSANAAGV